MKLKNVFPLIRIFIKSSEQQFLLEKYEKNDLSEWTSTTVIGNKVLFGYKKNITNKSGWKIYDPDKKDGKGEYSTCVIPNAEITKLALKAAKVIGKDIIGFDFIYTDDGYKVIDENGRPGIYRTCLDQFNISIVDVIVKLIESELPTT